MRQLVQVENTVSMVIERTVRSIGRTQFRAEGLRASAPPLCEIAVALKLLRGGVPSTPSFLSEYYTKVGSAAHLVIQKWLGRLGYLYGYWRCVPCKVRLRRKGVTFCPKCHREMQYEEMKVIIFPEYGFTGTVDGLLRLHKGFVVIDFKFVGDSTFKKVGGNVLEFSHYAQVSLYAYALKREYNITGCSVVYFLRSNPCRFKVVAFEPDESLVKYMRALIRRVYLILDNAKKRPKVVWKLKMKCASPEDAGFCPNVGVCFSESGPYPLLEMLVRRRS